MKVIKAFRGVKNGEVYPTELQPGEDCPPELEEAGIELGCVADDDDPAAKAAVVARKKASKGAAPENKAE